VAWTPNGKTYKNSTSKYLKNAVEESLKRLAIDYIDIYYLHWTDGITPIEESIDALVTLKKEGKIHSIGVSNLNIDELNKLQKKDIGAIQLKGNLLETNEIYKHKPYASKLKASLILFSTLADGLLTDKFNVSTKFDDEDHRNKYPLFEKNKFLECLDKIKLIKNLIKDYDATIPQVSLRWLLETEGVDAILFGSISSKNIKENLKCLDINFDDELYKYLKELIPLNP